MYEGGTINITDVRIRKISDDGKMRAVASDHLDDEFGESTYQDNRRSKRFVHRYAKQEEDGAFRDAAQF